MKKIIFFLFVTLISVFACKSGVQDSTQEQPDATLKSLVIRRTIGEDVTISPVPLTYDYNLKESITEANPVTIEVVANDDKATIYFDGEARPQTSKEYKKHKSNVLIVVRNGSQKTEYRVVIVEGPQNYSVKCNVVDSVGGTNVSGASIKVYESGTANLLQETTTSLEGNAFFALEGDKYYTFITSKKGSAGSRVENVYVPTNKRLFLPIVMRYGAKGTLAIAPEVTNISIRHNGNETSFQNNQEIDFSKITDGTLLYITVNSKSKRIIPVKKTGSENFGVAMSIGSPTAKDSSELMLLDGSKEPIKTETDGSITQRFSIALAKVLAEDGENTLYFTIYDVAGNRCEQHYKVIFKNSTLKQDMEDATSKFDIFEVYSERYYRSLGTFGMNTEEGTQTSARVLFTFKFNKNMAISKVNILRRPYQEGNITENWEVVYTKYYEKNFRGDPIKGFKLSDSSGSLQDGEMYQYKLEAYNKKGKVTSPIATIRLMEAFNIFLTTPQNRSQVLLSDIAKQDFAFRISNKNLWKTSDYFSFDIAIQDENVEFMFISKLRYYMNEEKYLQIAAGVNGENYKMFTDYNPSVTNIDELVNYNDGIFTLTSKFFNEANFNISSNKGTLATRIKKGGWYYWDIQDIGFSEFDVIDDRGAFFVKEYPYLDSKTGQLIGKTKSKSYSYSNLDIFGGSVNGKALFIVK